MKHIKLTILILSMLISTISYGGEVYKKQGSTTSSRVSNSFIFTNFTELEKYAFIVLMQGKINLHTQDLMDDSSTTDHIQWVLKIQCMSHAQLMWLSESLELTDLTSIFKNRADTCQQLVQGKITRDQYILRGSDIHKTFLKVMRNHNIMGRLVLDKNKQMVDSVAKSMKPVYTHIVFVSKFHASKNKK